MNYNKEKQKEEMTMAQLSMRIDDNVKAKAEHACEALGLTMTAAINLYLVKLGNEMRIPFEVSVDPFYSFENQTVLERSIKQLESGHGAEHEIVEVDA